MGFFSEQSYAMLLLTSAVTWLSLTQIRHQSLEMATQSLWDVNRLTAERLKQQSSDMIAASTALAANAPDSRTTVAAAERSCRPGRPAL